MANYDIFDFRHKRGEQILRTDAVWDASVPEETQTLDNL